MAGVFYLVPTPVGNLEDITLRALTTLKNVDYILCEDTRNSLKLLNHFEISKPLVSYYKDCEKKKSTSILNDILQGKNVALISDAGTPGISDPGYVLVDLCIKNDVEVVCLPGATAFVPAITVSGFDTSSFFFYGFISERKKSKKREELTKVLNIQSNVILYESPNRIKETLLMIDEIDSSRRLCLVREISKIHEQKLRGTSKDILENLTEKGEMVLVISAPEKVNMDLSKLDIHSLYSFYESQNMSKKDIIKRIAKDLKLPKNDVYMLFN